jgi:hypothetical protein
MTQLGEAVAIAEVEDFDLSCPFPHDECTHPYKGGNELEGNAETLGKNLEKAGKAGSTVMRTGSPFEECKLSTAHEIEPAVAPPGKDSSWANWVQLIPKNDKTWYPVGFQAHHLIPAAASLKGSSILAYVRSSGRVCCNMGYDVNGKENGVWLPGKHAVAGGNLGINLWGKSKRALPDNEEFFDSSGVARGPRDNASDPDSNRYLPLVGKTASKANQDSLDEVFHEKNMKWNYVRAATKIANRQFHDSHSKYSSKVSGHLKAIAETLARFHEVGKIKGTCKQGCKEKKKVPPSPRVLMLINKLSQGYKTTFLVGQTSHNEYFTSNWSKKG